MHAAIERIAFSTKLSQFTNFGNNTLLNSNLTVEGALDLNSNLDVLGDTIMKSSLHGSLIG